MDNLVKTKELFLDAVEGLEEESLRNLLDVTGYASKYNIALRNLSEHKHENALKGLKECRKHIMAVLEALDYYSGPRSAETDMEISGLKLYLEVAQELLREASYLMDDKIHPEFSYANRAVRLSPMAEEEITLRAQELLEMISKPEFRGNMRTLYQEDRGRLKRFFGILGRLEQLIIAHITDGATSQDMRLFSRKTWKVLDDYHGLVADTYADRRDGLPFITFDNFNVAFFSLLHALNGEEYPGGLRYSLAELALPALTPGIVGQIMESVSDRNTDAQWEA